MHLQLRMQGYDIHVPCEHVRKLLKELDPAGTEIRLANKLQRREYNAKGRNYMWHLDGYDKITPFGLCTHGGIDGFSRNVLWCKVGYTNQDPKIIAGYFMKAVKQCTGSQVLLHGD